MDQECHLNGIKLQMCSEGKTEKTTQQQHATKITHLCFSIIFPGLMEVPDVWQNHQVWHPGQQPWCILNPILFLTLLLSDATHLLGWHPTRALGWLKRETFWGIKLVNQESDGWVKIVVIDFCCFPFLLDFPSVNRSKFIEHAIEFVGHDVCWIVALCGIWGHIEAKAHRHTQQTIATKPLDSPSAIDYCATFT